MENRAEIAQLEYNRIFRENDEIYREIAKMMGMSDSAFWILYMLREGEGQYTQSDIRTVLCQPKQTVNTALKKLEQEGVLELQPMSDKRSKQVCLTVRGNHLASRTVDLVFGMERSAMEGLSPREQDTFLKIFRKYTQLLRTNAEKLRSVAEDDRKHRKLQRR